MASYYSDHHHVSFVVIVTTETFHVVVMSVAHFHHRFHRYIHVASCRLGVLRNIPSPTGWACYVTSPAGAGAGWGLLRNKPSLEGWALVT
jgi:hypothetical protein